ncbi:MAG: hypothetical protein AB7O80_23820 [Acetobacteraceae bacterium]
MISTELAQDATVIWIRWTIVALLSLIVVLLAVFWAGLNSALLLGWALGMILAATLNLFRRRDG